MPNRKVVRATDLYNMMFRWMFLFGFDDVYYQYWSPGRVGRFVFINKGDGDAEEMIIYQLFELRRQTTLL